MKQCFPPLPRSTLVVWSRCSTECVAKHCFISCCQQGSDVAHRRPGFVEIDAHDVADFKLWSAADVRQSVAMLAAAKGRVAAGTMSAIDCSDIEMAVGLHHNPGGILASDALAAHMDPVAACTYDWVHSMLQDGVLTMEISAFLVAADVPRIDVSRFKKDDAWLFPKERRSHCKQLHRIFDERRMSATNPSKVKASCSELLGLYGLLRHYVECTVPPVPEHERARASFLAACSVMDAMLAAKFRMMQPADAAALVQERMSRFMVLHKSAYGATLIKPKHHWQMDVPPQILRDGLVLDFRRGAGAFGCKGSCRQRQKLGEI